jgi:hypothetical protein
LDEDKDERSNGGRHIIKDALKHALFIYTITHCALLLHKEIGGQRLETSEAPVFIQL